MKKYTCTCTCTHINYSTHLHVWINMHVYMYFHVSVRVCVCVCRTVVSECWVSLYTTSSYLMIVIVRIVKRYGRDGKYLCPKDPQGINLFLQKKIISKPSNILVHTCTCSTVYCTAENLQGQ